VGLHHRGLPGPFRSCAGAVGRRRRRVAAPRM